MAFIKVGNRRYVACIYRRNKPLLHIDICRARCLKRDKCKVFMDAYTDELLAKENDNEPETFTTRTENPEILRT